MTGTLLLAVVFVLYIAAVAACTRRIARRHGRGRP